MVVVVIMVIMVMVMVMVVMMMMMMMINSTRRNGCYCTSLLKDPVGKSFF